MTKKRIQVVHLCVTDEGGAGLCCRRIHRAMKGLGVESHVLTMLKFTSDKEVMRVHWGLKWFLYRAVNKILLYLKLPLTNKVKISLLERKAKEPLSNPSSVFKDLPKHPLLRDADIIHLHSVTGFIDYPSFFRKIEKPIVWTLHDENLFNGLAHFSRTKVLDAKLDKQCYNIKLKALHEAKRLGVVFLSDMMWEKYHSHEMLDGHRSVIINNPVDTDVFKPYDKNVARKRLGIEEDALVFIFVAAFINDSWKGLKELCVAFEKLHLDNAVILAVGKKLDIEYPSFVKAIGPIYEGEKLSEAYSAADYFVSASTQEAFAQTPIEAMACGIPAILTPVSGTSELITEDNGVRCGGFSVEAIVEAIRKALSRQYDAQVIRKDILNRFSTTGVAKKYLAFYSQMLDATNLSK